MPPRQDVTEGYASDWTIDQLHNAAQQVADKIDEIIIAVGALAAGTPHAAA